MNRRCRVSLLFVGLCAVSVSACLPKFPNLKGKLIHGSAVEKLIAKTKPITIHSQDLYKKVFYHVNSEMRACLADKPNVYRGYIFDSFLDEDNKRGELATLRDKAGFGNRAETYVLIQSDTGGTKILVHTRETFMLEKWRKWFAGEHGCFPELMG